MLVVSQGLKWEIEKQSCSHGQVLHWSKEDSKSQQLSGWLLSSALPIPSTRRCPQGRNGFLKWEGLGTALLLSVNTLLFNGWRWALGSLKSHSPAKFPGRWACWFQLDGEPQPTEAPYPSFAPDIMLSCPLLLFFPFHLDHALPQGDHRQCLWPASCLCISPGICHDGGQGAAPKLHILPFSRAFSEPTPPKKAFTYRDLSVLSAHFLGKAGYLCNFWRSTCLLWEIWNWKLHLKLCF